MSSLETFDPSRGDRYDPGQIVVLFDGRQSTSPESKMSTFQTYWLDGMYRLGWPSLYTPDLEPRKIRLVWYTHAGNEGTRDFPLWKANAVKEMFDSLADEGFRPMILGWSAENPFPMIGGSEPPPEPKKAKPRVATSSSGTVSGHGKAGTNPHDRIMAIIDQEEREEARMRKEDVEKASLAKVTGQGDAV